MEPSGKGCQLWGLRRTFVREVGELGWQQTIGGMLCGLGSRIH